MVSVLDISSKMRACKYAAHRSGASFVSFPAFSSSELNFGLTHTSYFRRQTQRFVMMLHSVFDELKRVIEVAYKVSTF
jgi:hypothetical protein